MSRNYSKYLQFLAADANLLYIGKTPDKKLNEIFPFFASILKIDSNQDMLDKISFTLTKREINIIIIDADKNTQIVQSFYNAIKKFNLDILTILMFHPKEYESLLEIIPLVDTTISYPVNEKVFCKKIFGVLSIPYTIKSIGRRDIVLKQESTVETSIDEFFDMYEGSSLFLSDDLLSLSKDLNNGTLSYELFNEIATKIDEVASIFIKNEETKYVSAVFFHLSQYLSTLKLEEIQPENLQAFNYLSDILSDVSIYLLDMFVDRIFKDVYIFSESLKSNIEFMQNALEGQNNDEGELDFF